MGYIARKCQNGMTITGHLFSGLSREDCHGEC
jgi:hypothetical protein